MVHRSGLLPLLYLHLHKLQALISIHRDCIQTEIKPSLRSFFVPSFLHLGCLSVALFVFSPGCRAFSLPGGSRRKVECQKQDWQRVTQQRQILRHFGASTSTGRSAPHSLPSFISRLLPEPPDPIFHITPDSFLPFLLPIYSHHNTVHCPVPF